MCAKPIVSSLADWLLLQLLFCSVAILVLFVKCASERSSGDEWKKERGAWAHRNVCRWKTTDRVEFRHPTKYACLTLNSGDTPWFVQFQLARTQYRTSFELPLAAAQTLSQNSKIVQTIQTQLQIDKIKSRTQNENCVEQQFFLDDCFPSCSTICILYVQWHIKTELTTMPSHEEYLRNERTNEQKKWRW